MDRSSGRRSPPPPPPPIVDPYWPVWTQGFTYGSDIAAAVDPATGDHWVFIDYSNTHEDKITIGRYNWTATDWPDDHPLSWIDPTPTVAPNITALARDIAVEGDKWLLVAANGGFLVIDRVAGQVTDWVYTNSVQSLSFDSVMGIDKSGDRIFASLGDPTNRFAIAMYAFDAATGHVVGSMGQQTDHPIQVLFDGQELPGGGNKPDHFPGVFVTEGEKISLIVTQVNPKKLRLYSGSGNGNVLEIEWQASNNTMTPLSYWNNGGYFNLITDCNVYNDPTPLGGASFGPGIDLHLRVIVAKAQETFEIVIPPGME